MHWYVKKSLILEIDFFLLQKFMFEKRTIMTIYSVLIIIINLTMTNKSSITKHFLLKSIILDCYIMVF